MCSFEFSHCLPVLCCRWQILAAGRACCPEPRCGEPTTIFLAIIEDIKLLTSVDENLLTYIYYMSEYVVSVPLWCN